MNNYAEQNLNRRNNWQRMARETISYTDNNIGSGKYCDCGQELTHNEWKERRYKSYSVCKHVDCIY